MASFNLNDTIGLLMRILNNHQEIIRLWHDVTNLLQRLGLITPAQAQTRYSSHTFDVRWVQQELNKQIKAGLDVDGVMGPKTVEAVMNYQRARGLDPDGWIGVLTLAQLEKDSSR